jgi:hypothetical protein
MEVNLGTEYVTPPMLLEMLAHTAVSGEVLEVRLF